MRPDKAPVERNLGEQPLAQILREHGLKPYDLVASSSDGLTHKMVTRACKGRWCTPNTRAKVVNALQHATGQSWSPETLFTYGE